MHARMFMLQISPEKMDEFIQLWHTAMLPTAKEQKGWKSARLLVDRTTGKAIIIGLWEIEADALASGAGSTHAEKQRAIGSLNNTPPAESLSKS